jgi:ribonuclease D
LEEWPRLVPPIEAESLMTNTQILPFEIVEQPTSLEAAIRDLTDQTAISLDTESNSRHHYPEQLCLVQINGGRKVYIIDTIKLKDLFPLKLILENKKIQKIIHGADYDIRCFDRHYQFRIHNLYDTSIAARFAGIAEFGLAALIRDLLNVKLLKSERLQQADWGRRPLSVEALEYAAGDVHYLLDLRDVLNRRLQALGRAEWVTEECARLEEIRYSAPDIQNAYLSIKGGQSLDGKGLAVLRRLFLFREEQALRQGRPPFFVMPDHTLTALASNPSADLSNVSGIGPIGLQRFGTGLQQALRLGQADPPIKRPENTFERLSHEQASRLSYLKAWRSTLGGNLALDPSLLWPTASLDRLARDPGNFEIEIQSPIVRNWQRKLFTDSLRASLVS